MRKIPILWNLLLLIAALCVPLCLMFVAVMFMGKTTVAIGEFCFIIIIVIIRIYYVLARMSYLWAFNKIVPDWDYVELLIASLAAWTYIFLYSGMCLL